MVELTQIFKNLLCRAAHQARLVSVLDANDETTVIRSREQVIVKRGTQTAQVQMTCRTWRESHSNVSRFIDAAAGFGVLTVAASPQHCILTGLNHKFDRQRQNTHHFLPIDHALHIKVGEKFV